MGWRVFAFSAFFDRFAYFALLTRYVLTVFSGSMNCNFIISVTVRRNTGQGRDKFEFKILQVLLNIEWIVCFLDSIRLNLWDWSSLLSSLLAVRTSKHSPWFSNVSSVQPFLNLNDKVRFKWFWFQIIAAEVLFAIALIWGFFLVIYALVGVFLFGGSFYRLSIKIANFLLFWMERRSALLLLYLTQFVKLCKT